MRKLYALLMTLLIISLLIVCFGCENASAERDLILYELDIVMDTDEMTAEITAIVTYTNYTQDTLTSLNFNMYPLAFCEGTPYFPVTEQNMERVYYNGLSYGRADILRVHTDSVNLNYYIEKHMLNVIIPPLKPFEKIEITIRYYLKLPDIRHRYGYNDNSINLNNFYPQLMARGNDELDGIYYPIGDPFVSEVADYKVSLKVNNSHKVAATGESVSKEVNVINSTYKYKASRVRDFAIVMSDKFTLISDTVEGIEVNYYYYNDPMPEVSHAAAVSAIKVFSALIGKYPYKVYNVVETDFFQGGMEYPMLVMISSFAEGSHRHKIIVHETAHQWWYGIVGSDSIREPWMDEGLTEFMTALYYNEAGQSLVMKQMIDDTLKAYIHFTMLSVIINTSMLRALNEYATEYEYVMIVYYKGMLLFNCLYEIMGRDSFVDAIRLYYSENAYKIATSDGLIDIFNKTSNKNLNKVFDAWLSGKVVIAVI